MKDCYELKNPRKNPYAERMKKGYTIVIDHNPDEDEESIQTETSSNSVPQLQTRAPA